MFKLFGLMFAVAFGLTVASEQSGAQEATTPLIPETPACGEPEILVPLPARYAATWSTCEKWVWSCVARGLEANLFAKRCTNARRDADETNYRSPYELAPFVSPGDYQTTNALSDTFIRDILTDPLLTASIPSIGIRIFGAYFDRSVNLENVTTSTNLVLDAAILRRGLRMTNFESTKNVSLDGANVRGRLLAMRARLGGSLFIEQGVYDYIDLRDARIGASLEASRSVFNDMLRIDRAHIAGKVYLVKSLITSLTAWDATIGGSMEFRMADIRLRMDLTGATVQGDVRLQSVTAGSRVSERSPSCEWNPDQEINNVFQDTYRRTRTHNSELASDVLDEMMRTRPTQAGKPTNSLCDEPDTTGLRSARHEFLLRDMKINGTLCIMDTSGAIRAVKAHTNAPAGSDTPLDLSIDTVSLDGTHANSTVLRWPASASTTLWHAVNFKTGHMLINLHAPPEAHFIDNLDVGFISFVRNEGPLRETQRDEDDDKYLCDVTPRQENVDRADSRETQERIQSFFTGEANKAGSAQPFGVVIDRLKSSGINTRFLDIKLSEYKNRTACKTSSLMQTWTELHWISIREHLAALSLDESRKLVLDGVCTAGVFASKWLVSYGHEPLNLFLWAILLVVLFWAALQLDRPDPITSLPRQRYPLAYSFDNFIPLRPYRSDRVSADRMPNSRWLRLYRGFHRTCGLVFAVLIFIFVYRAST